MPFDDYLSKNFRLPEFTRSATASRHGIDIEVDDPAVYENLKRLCEDVLQPLRDHFGQPITVLSGYRPPAVNSLVGGSRTSAHMYGRAGDVVMAGVPTIDVCRFFETYHELPFDQVIDEFGRWAHIGIARAGTRPRRQFLTARKRHGRTHYSYGLQG